MVALAAERLVPRHLASVPGLRADAVGTDVTLVVRDRATRPDNATSPGVAETGQPWAAGDRADAATLPTPGVLGGALYFAANGNQGDPHAWVETLVADGTIRARVTVPTFASGSQAGILFRRVDASNYFLARLNNAGQQVNLFRNLATVTSTPVAVSLAIADGQVILLEVRLRGARIQVVADGAVLIDTADPNMTTGTKHGPFGVSGAFRINDFQVLA